MSNCTFSVQCLQVDDLTLYCRLQCTVVVVGVVLKDSLLFDGCIKSSQVVRFSARRQYRDYIINL